MKKFFLYSFIILSIIGLSSYTLLAEETESQTSTITDNDDSIEQVKEDVYNDIYNDVYQDVYEDIIEDINEDTYQNLYKEIETGFYDHYQELSILNDEIQNKIYDVVDLANDSVVGIETYAGSYGVSLGSGVIYKYNQSIDFYYVITNYHVVEGGNNFKIRFEDESTVDADLLTYDEEADIALLSFFGLGVSGLRVAPLGSSGFLDKGDIILAAGNPRGFNFYNSITLGIVAGKDRSVDGESITYIQHDAAINSGNSGGPIFNLEGEVVGINVLKYASEEIEGMGFSIPINLVKTIINDYESK
ncbi:trypsin-like peptidase domain-containing protein [Mycoplasmatota bacterium]|nr:trypsin-like peptidase domain-containing protein [Mycoplasmatota bacterium]